MVAALPEVYLLEVQKTERATKTAAPPYVLHMFFGRIMYQNQSVE
jgi:hypothetical protein